MNFIKSTQTEHNFVRVSQRDGLRRKVRKILYYLPRPSKKTENIDCWAFFGLIQNMSVKPKLIFYFQKLNENILMQHI